MVWYGYGHGYDCGYGYGYDCDYVYGMLWYGMHACTYLIILASILFLDKPIAQERKTFQTSAWWWYG